MTSQYPNLLIIGAMKSGTTSLHDYLSKHSDIFMSNPKEIHYYNPLSKLKKEEYLSHFKSDKKIRGTTPQSYTKAHHKDFQNIPEKIYRDTPNVKLIYIIRDPFERILSHVLENRYGENMKSIRANQQSEHYWKTSLYYYQLSFFLKYFKKDQIHLLSLEAMKKNKLQELNKVFQFLGVNELKDESVFDYLKNDAESKKIPQFIKSRFWFRCLNKIHPSISENLALNLIEKKYKSYLLKPTLGGLVNADIVKQIQMDAFQLEKEFNFDLSSWNLNPVLGE